MVLNTCRLLGIGVLLSLALSAGAGQENRDLEKLQGTWKVLAANEAGKTLPPSRVKASRLVVTGNTMKVHEPEKVREMTFVLRPTKEPAEIDMAISQNKGKGDTAAGIYLLEGDLLKICFALPGKARPTNFTPAPGSGEMLFVLKRMPSKSGEK
jgi:uncharacterized protein (TIGR03067 family)